MKARLVLLLMIMITMAFFVTGCSSKEQEQSVRDTYVKYLKAVEAENVEEASTHLAGYLTGTKEDQMMLAGQLEIAIAYLKMQKVDVTSFVIKEVSVTDNQAVIIVEMPFSGEVKNKQVTMVLEDNQWKVESFGGIK